MPNKISPESLKKIGFLSENENKITNFLHDFVRDACPDPERHIQICHIPNNPPFVVAKLSLIDGENMSFVNDVDAKLRKVFGKSVLKLYFDTAISGFPDPYGNVAIFPIQGSPARLIKYIDRYEKVNDQKQRLAMIR